jgi:uncharacterized protein (DUF488 family)
VTFPFFTIGHSSRGFVEFVELLRDAQIQCVVDVRAFPRSRTHPQFNESTLPDALLPFDVSYEHMADLGGRRRASGLVPPETNGLWENQSFHNYADYAFTEPFHAGLEHLIALGRTRRCVIMCSEAVWWRCHRRIISDYLIARNEPVFHIIGKGQVGAAQLTLGAAITSARTVTYPALIEPQPP